jgi:signal transduction histidine kinase
MSCPPAWIRFLTLLLLIGPVGAAESNWDNRLAETFSGRWKEIQTELAELAEKVDELPGIPIDDQGGTGGFSSIYPLAAPPVKSPYLVEVRWESAAKIDLVALVPARRYDAKGLDPQYGLPAAFTVELIGPSGEVVRRVATERRTAANPARKGHPFVYQISPPVTASGLRISAERLNPDYEGGLFVQSWAEAMAFEGSKNVALEAKVSSTGGETPPAPWHWNPDYLVDGETPLGLPEIPAESHANIGWISESRSDPNEPATLSVDLGEVLSVDAVRLIPAKRPTSDLPSGFGFPRKLEISVSETGGTGENGGWKVVAKKELGNPGHNPVLIPFDAVKARFIKVEATVLWKSFDSYPAFFALSELEVTSEEKNLAVGKRVYSSDGMISLVGTGGRVWSAAALSDGFGPEGMLVPTREWMILLDQRLRLETQRNQLQAESDHLVEVWRRATRISASTLILAGAFVIVFLPIRYRLHAVRELAKVRERIAGDLHDEVGSNLGSVQMLADLAEGRSGSSHELKRIQRIAAETVSAVRDIVWLLRPTGDHRIATVEHLRETSSIMLEPLEWKFTANDEAWQVELPEESNRDLFLFFRESLHNIMRHAGATSVQIRAEKTDHLFKLQISDNGVGITPERLERPATFRALRQRAEALRGTLEVETEPGKGTHLNLTVPLERKQKRSQWRMFGRTSPKATLFE